MKTTTKEVTTKFFNAILQLMSEATSDEYAIVALRNVKKKLKKDFPLLKYIDVADPTDVDPLINKVDTVRLGKLLGIIIDTVGSDIVKRNLAQQLNKDDLLYLSKLGVRLPK